MSDTGVARFVIAGGLALAVACGNGGLGTSQSSCDPDDGTWPRCESETTVVYCWADGSVEVRECDGDQTCAEEWIGSRRRVTCLPEGSAFCDPDEFTPTCADDQTLVECSDPYDIFTHTTICDGMCFEAEGGAICAREGTTSCDPDDFELSCLNDAIVDCYSGGFTIVEEDCAADDRVCRMRDGEPFCVEEDATPCVPSMYIAESCVDGHVRSCNSDSRFTELVRACAADEVCLIDQCFPEDLLPCEVGAERLCSEDGSQLLTCDQVYGVYVPEDCPDGGFCVGDLGSAECTDADAVPCDFRTFEPSCADEATQIVCSSDTGYTKKVECPMSLLCKTSDFGGYCVPGGAEECDPTTYQATCDDGAAYRCNIGTHFTEAEVCSDGICVADDFLGLSVSLCVPEDAPTCFEPSDMYCSLNGPALCIGGREIWSPCGSVLDALCLGDGKISECVLVDAPACSPSTFEQSCDGDVLTHCVVGSEVETRCRDYGLVCDPVQGCVPP